MAGPTPTNILDVVLTDFFALNKVLQWRSK
jgi:hypothetical protein